MIKKYKRLTKEEFDLYFKNILNLVKSGYTISGASRKLEVISKATLYNLATEEQLRELKEAKTLNATYGSGMK